MNGILTGLLSKRRAGVTPKARIGAGPYPEAWFPWINQGRPNLYVDDVFRIQYSGKDEWGEGAIFSNETTVAERPHDEAWSATGKWQIVAIGVRLSRIATVERLCAISGYEVDPKEAAEAMEQAALYCLDTWSDDLGKQWAAKAREVRDHFESLSLRAA